MVKLNYNALHKLSKNNYIKRPHIAVLYYDIDKTIKFTNAHILFILNIYDNGFRCTIYNIVHPT